MLQTSWNRCWTRLGAKGDGHASMRELLAAYEEPQRKYHALQHLKDCLTLLDKHRDMAQEPAEVEMALWFHDAIYDVTGQDNEARSAALAVEALSKAGVATQPIERVRQHILATRHAALPEDADQQLLVDIDLAILGADRARFDEYEIQIRAEYDWVPEAIFRQKRAEVLRGFLSRQHIFNTAPMREAFEDRAQGNLAYSLERLEGGTFTRD